MKNFLIVGASSGIGKQLAETLAEASHRVFGTYCNNPVESSTVAYHQLDVLDDELNLDFLPDELHGLVYCPGSINLKPFHRIKPEDFSADFNLQVVGGIKVLQAVLPKLKAGAGASVVLFSTVAVQSGFPFHAQVSASKGAVEGLTRALAAEWAPTIRVNSIAPSLTDTPLSARMLSSEDKKEANAKRHPMKRIGKPEDMASMAEFLLSDKSDWISGQVFTVDGGISNLRV